MAGSVKFDPSSNSPDGPSYMNGQRGSYGASLDRSGSFREGSEGRMLSSGSSRPSSLSQADAMGLLQSLLPDIKLVSLDPKYARQGDLKKVLTSVIGACQDESPSHNFGAKSASALSPEEFKRAKSSLHEYLIKARERSKYFGELASKYEKYLSNNSTKKRSRTDVASMERSSSFLSGAGMTKMGSQVHPALGALDQASQRSDERPKGGIPNRRMRTAMVVDGTRMDQRSTGLKPCNTMERERDTNKFVKAGEEEKSSGVGWDLKGTKKKKRTGVKPEVSDQNVVIARTVGDREPKHGLHQRLANDAQQRMGNNLSFRSSARDETPVCPAATTNRSNIAARAPRSNGIPSSRMSPSVHRTSGSPEESEVPSFSNKNNSGIASGNRKRSAPTQSSPPPVTQWVGQRHHKMSRSARRTNFPLVSGHDDIPFSDVETCVRVSDNVELPRHPSVFSTQMKATGEHTYSTGLSESDESAIMENKSKEKVKKCAEMNDKTEQTVQRAATPSFLPRKNKISGDGEDELGDGARRLARPGRAFPPLRPGAPSTSEKHENSGSAKQPRNVKFDAERSECKPGRPTTKKFQERKGYHRPRYETAELHGEAEDDHEELLLAAKHALNTRCACPSKLWRDMESYFALISSEESSFLKKQGDLICYAHPAIQVKDARDDCDLVTNGVEINKCNDISGLSVETEQVNELSLEDAIQTTQFHSGITICQLLLSAMIEEVDENEPSYYCKGGEEECFSNDNCSNPFATNFNTKANEMDHLPLENAQRVRAFSNGYISANLRLFDEPNHHNLENCNVGPEYSQMCVEDRILLELNEIGISPGPMPDLAQSEDEEISEGIRRLEEKLHEEVMLKKNMFSKLEKTFLEAKESQERELERIALDKLVGIAYGKYMAALRSSSSSGSKNTNKISKLRAFSFVKRTVARCQAFEQTGKSCFSESPFKEMFQSVSSSMNEFEGPDAADGHSTLPAQPGLKNSKNEKFLDAVPVNTVENSSGKDELWSNKVKKRELLLNVGVGGVGNLVSGIKGKRSERDRDGKRNNRDAAGRNGTSRVGRPALSNSAKGDRKNKTKPKQKLTQLSASFSNILGNDTLPFDPKAHESAPDGNAKQKDGSGMAQATSDSQDVNDHGPMDLSHLQIPDVLGIPDDFGSQPQDFGTWFNFDDEGLQDQDLVGGLEIPMDDLSDLNMVL